MKQIIFPLLLSILPLSACGNSSETAPLAQSSATKVDAELSPESKEIINEYNQILIQSQSELDPQITNQKLKKILPKISKINSENERNNLLLNINMRLGNYEEAFAITNTILEKKRNNQYEKFSMFTH